MAEVIHSRLKTPADRLGNRKDIFFTTSSEDVIYDTTRSAAVKQALGDGDRTIQNVIDNLSPLAFASTTPGELTSINDEVASGATTYSSKKIDELIQYVMENGGGGGGGSTAFDITSFSSPNMNNEIGSTLTEVTFNWSINSTLKSLMLNDIILDTTATSYTLHSSITSDTRYNLTAISSKNATATKTLTIAFINGIYYGVSSNSNISSSDDIKALTKKLQTSKSLTFTVNPGSGEYIYYIIPASYGEPTFNVGGFDGGFTMIGTVQFTNNYGNTTAYNVYRSTNDSLGNTTVKVS